MIAVGARTRLAGVIGHPVAHSRSPAIHNAAYRALGLDAVYLAFAVAPGALREALAGARALQMMGLNVTVPHKQAALPLCDEVDEAARRVGAVNTVAIRGGRLLGSNTDVEGFGRSLREALAATARRAVVLGSGGAARAVVVALASLGLATSLVARSAERARALLALGAIEAAPWAPGALRRLLAGADILVDATSAALTPDGEARLPAAIPLEALPPGALVVSLVYSREPALLRDARARGLRVLDGAGMLVHQAALAFKMMTGLEAPLDVMWAAFRSPA